ncbi:hypothetical protein Tco_0551366 [Tanacetum coccineum]
MQRACAIDFGKAGVNHLPLVGSHITISYSASIKAAHLSTLWSESVAHLLVGLKVGEALLLGPELIQETHLRKNHSDKAWMQAARDRQKSDERVGEVAYKLELPEEIEQSS